MTPERFSALIETLLDDRLQPHERDELLQEAAADPERSRILIEMLRLDPLLKDFLAHDEESGGFPQRMKHAVGAAGNTSRFAADLVSEFRKRNGVVTMHRTSRRTWLWRGIAAASVAAVIGIVVTYVLTSKQSLATVEALSGRAFVLRAGSKELPLVTATAVERGQGVRCEEGTVRVLFHDGSSAELSAGGVIQNLSDTHAGEPGPAITLGQGELTADVRPQPANWAFRVITPTAVVKVLGTRFTVAEYEQSTRVQVHEGKVQLKRATDGEGIEVPAGFFAVAAPELQLAARPVRTEHNVNVPALVTASYLGGPGEDSIVGIAIQADGSVILAANLEGDWNGKVPMLLDGALASHKGIIVRFSSDGRTVLALSRVASALYDLATDASGAVYAAAETEGVIKLSASGTQVLRRIRTEFPCTRLDAASDGTVAALLSSGKNTGRIDLYSPNGERLSAFTAPYVPNDVAVDAARRLVYVGGTRPGQTARGEIGSVAYVDAFSFDGAVAWKNYGIDPGTKTELKSHTTCERIAMGADGKLYGAFLAIGGSNIFSRDPKSFETKVKLHGVDAFSQAYATGHTYITFVARFDPSTGDLLAGQLLLGRDKARKGTDVSPAGGNIAADEQGRVYVVGRAESGGPAFSDSFGGGEYSGHEGFFCIFSPDLQRREFYTNFNSTAQGGSALHAVAIPRNRGTGPSFALVGSVRPASGGMRVINAQQPAKSNGQDGYFSIGE